ncbi:hypothetical protein F25303_3522 [Fusarium sp. NRRL 25303]|nr:hypothetical protein F25303_3522 [Fusarium sp. NRRL 25303]
MPAISTILNTRQNPHLLWALIPPICAGRPTFQFHTHFGKITYNYALHCQSNEMAGPKPKATPATVVEVADEGGVVILSDDPVNSLTVDDLPIGVLKDANKQTAA